MKPDNYKHIAKLIEEHTELLGLRGLFEKGQIDVSFFMIRNVERGTGMNAAPPASIHDELRETAIRAIEKRIQEIEEELDDQ
ncbi:MAG: hypothetical protein ACXABY_19975 [Candidatus Thorarchaeota archaeon]|jgi:hypothetical protein